jgi:hypothetical protein
MVLGQERKDTSQHHSTNMSPPQKPADTHKHTPGVRAPTDSVRLPDCMRPKGMSHTYGSASSGDHATTRLLSFEAKVIAVTCPCIRVTPRHTTSCTHLHVTHTQLAS